MSGISIAKSLELHLLRPLVTGEDVDIACARAADAHLATVCVWPVHVPRATRLLAGSDTKVRAAIGFPFGQERPATKLAACDQAVADGAHELVVMLDHTGLTSRDGIGDALRELDAVLSHAWWSSVRHARGSAELAIALETTMLELRYIEPLLARLTGSPAGFVQIGTGHQHVSVTDQDVRRVRELLPADVAVIAVGGVNTWEDAAALVSAGAVRVGSPMAVSIVEQERAERTRR